MVKSPVCVRMCVLFSKPAMAEHVHCDETRRWPVGEAGSVADACGHLPFRDRAWGSGAGSGGDQTGEQLLFSPVV